ncbi:ATP-grasp domain-containing protein [Confluentibacter lentus]|uniref:ATP-grasp domain-containing protein n=1 Tax=Confluentibacter lentus TaxID=1699412 RepID=UPI000C28FEBA|nr:ATP-grasp domain-containing protein [Confluentibacter lentus]
MTIIFTSSGRRNYLISYFKKIIGDSGKIIALDCKVTAPSLQVADVGILVPNISSENYIPELKKIILKYKADLLIPLNDLDLPVISKHKHSLEAIGVKVIVSDKRIIDITLDKWKSFCFLKEANIDTPETFLNIEDALSSVNSNKISFPLIVKPRWGSGSIEISKVNDELELRLTYSLLKLKKHRMILHELNEENSDDFIIIQEFIEGQEYGMDILNDFNGSFVKAFVRKKIAMRSGETDQAQTVSDEKFESIGEKLGRITGHIGIMDCDFFVSNEKIFMLEMNPRFGGGYPFSHAAGINIPEIYIYWHLGKNNIEKYLNYNTGLSFAKYDSIISVK